MILDDSILKFEERAAFSLRSLYHRHGYARYKMSRFEEYDLYARNKDFLVSDSIITFTDTNGKLMALKPDMTLSIVRNTKDAVGFVQRIYYDENVYRVTPRSHVFEEIRQVGLECIGSLDDYCIAEVLILAAESLQSIGGDSVLDISHVGIMESILDGLSLPAACRPDALRCIAEMNPHGFAAVLSNAGVSPETIGQFENLTSLCGQPEEILPRLRALGADEQAVSLLEKTIAALNKADTGVRLRLNLSAGGDMKYYNGIVFRGYVDGVPDSVLSGGRYDKLVRKMGKKAGAIGFAVYLDRLELLRNERPYDVDALLVYDPACNADAILKAIHVLTAEGMQVSAQRNKPEGIRYHRLYQIDGKGDLNLAENN